MHVKKLCYCLINPLLLKFDNTTKYISMHYVTRHKVYICVKLR